MAKLGQYADQLPSMSAQEVLDAVKEHLLEQGEPSLRQGSSYRCAYKGIGGKCCAAAIFIKDYSPGMEGQSWTGLVESFNQCDNHKNLIRNLQKIHDACPPEEWEEYLDEVRLKEFIQK